MGTAAAGGWLPEHQSHAFFTTAHVNKIVANLTSVLERYQSGEPVKLERRVTATEEHVVLIGIAPLPQAVSRLFADALNAARNALEHCLFAEVGHRLDRPPSVHESKALEVPALTRLEDFETWAKHKHRASTGLFARGDDLYERLLRLQPLQRKDTDAHPLRVLTAHTNYAKHREPSLSVTRVAQVTRDSDLTRKPIDSLEIMEAGQVLASVPLGTRELFSIWPEVAVQRPHTGQWLTLMKDVGEIVDWVRTIALPVLIMGRTDLPRIPPQLDIELAYESTDDAWRAAGEIPAAKVMQNAIGAAGLRVSMLDMLVLTYGEGSRDAFRRWFTAMDDATVMARVWPVLESATRQNPRRYALAIAEWATEAGIDASDVG